MNRGLKEVPGVSDTASAAAWAKRFEGPMTKVSKVDLGLRWVSPPFCAEETRAGPVSGGAAGRASGEAEAAAGARGEVTGGSGSGRGSSVTTLIEGSTVMAMRTVRPREAVRAAVSWLEARSSIHDFVKALGTASRIVPSMSPRGRADRSMDVAAGPSSLVGTVSSASAHALVMVSVATLSSRASRL